MEGILIFYIGIDSIKGTLIELNGNERANFEKSIDLLINEEYAEHNPEQWFERIIEIIRDIQEKFPDITLESIAVTYQPGTFVCIDRSGNHLMNAILPCDRRAKYQAELCYKEIKKHSTLHHVSWEHMILPKLLWIKYNKPDIYKKTFKILTPDGYLAYRLCGETAIDNYSAIFLGYNTKTNHYNNKIINDFELDINIFPAVRKIGDCVGVISGVTKEKLNLKSDVKFIMATNSIIPLSLICINNEKKTILYDMESCDTCLTDNYIKLRKNNGLIRLLYKDDKYVYFFPGNYEMQFFKWMHQYISLAEINNANYTIGSNGMLVMPYIMGDGTFYNPDMRASVIGINSNNINDIITACFESAGYILRDKIEYLSNTGIDIASIEVISNIKCELLYEILSNITGKKIIINDNDNVLVMNIFYMIKAETNIDNTKKIELNPDEKLSYKYGQLYNLYKTSYSSLNDIYKFRRKVLKRITS